MRRCTVPAVLFVLLCAGVAALAATVETAQACSCGLGDPRTALAEADAAFVGVYVGGRQGPVGTRVAVHSFQVEEVVKGVLPATLEVTSSDSGASCGLEFARGQRVGLLLTRTGSTWTATLCAQMAPETLRQAGRPLPPPASPGPVRLLVGGRFGSVRTLALDAGGRTVAYGRGEGESVLVTSCPGGRRMAELVREGSSFRLAVRATRSLGRLREVRISRLLGGMHPSALLCRDAAAAEIFVFGSTAGSGAASARSRILRLRGRALTILHRGSAHGVRFGSERAHLNEGRFGRDLVSIDLKTGHERKLARVPERIGVLTPSPDGRQLAGIVPTGSMSPAQLVVVDLSRKPAALRTTPLGISLPYASGDVAWLDRHRLAYLPSASPGGEVRVYDRALRPLGRIGGWDVTKSVVVGGLAFGVAGDRLRSARLPGGPATELGRLVGPFTLSLAAVPRPARAARSSTPAANLRLLTELNAVRSARGLVALRLSSALSSAALAHSRDMARKGYFSHTSKDGTPFDRRLRRYYPAAGFRTWAAGENLLWRTGELSAETAIRTWMRSRGHRLNMLSARWREIGLGIVARVSAPGVYRGADVTIVTANFGARS